MTDAIILRVPLGTMVEFPSFIKKFFDHFSANFKFKIEPYFKYVGVLKPESAT